MYQTLFRSWKFAALWAIGISACIAAFFADGGGHEQFEESAQVIRDKRSGGKKAAPAAPAAVAAPAPAPVESPVAEPEEPAFGEPMDPGTEDPEAPSPSDEFAY